MDPYMRDHRGQVVDPFAADLCVEGGGHDWTLRPESDTWVCEICGAER